MRVHIDINAFLFHESRKLEFRIARYGEFLSAARRATTYGGARG